MTDAIPMTVLRVNHHSAQHIAQRYPYAGYGSNLWMAQISERCPKVELVTAGKLLDHRLDFAKVATITTDKTSTVPVGIYKLTASDIERLDRHEGIGRTYDRVLITAITDDARALRCFSYVKRDPTLEPPSEKYFGKLLAGYRDWHFDDRRLRHARARAVESWAASAPARTAAAKLIDSVKDRSAGARWAQGEMWEPLGNVVPLAPKRFVCMRCDAIEFGFKDGEHFFRKRGERVWYRDLSGHNDVQAGMVRGELATDLPGAQAYRLKKNGGK